jgi:hypothetical protein
MARFHLISGVKVPFTLAEETARDADEAQWLVTKQAEKAAKDAEVAKKASGKQKLKDLGLDDEEIKALTGA